ncbi:hypothetical protein LB456_05945 [Psychroflexus sp. CAK57W]|uniref:hypothetical protein n=1 Tax=Psychroflexus curvus TaxID=2873595 RepID=UPI001CD00D9B|nr:hypothetical protein [Psychroflexus curvus]MBZ9786996.1 hypothetical protein [Psychroflexus curvus]
MEKSLPKKLFGEKKGQAKIDFYEKLKKIKINYSEYLKENNLDFERLYNFKISDHDVYFNIENQSISKGDLGKEMREAFESSFSKLFKKD